MELSIPLLRSHILVVKRTTAAAAALASLDTETLHNMVVAVTLACEQLMELAESAATPPRRLRIEYAIHERVLAVTISAKLAVSPPQRTSPEGLPDDIGLRLMALMVDSCSYGPQSASGAFVVRLKTCPPEALPRLVAPAAPTGRFSD